MKKLLLLLLCTLLLSCSKSNDPALKEDTVIALDKGVTPVSIDSTELNRAIISLLKPFDEQLDGEILLQQNNNPAFKTRTWQGIPSITAAPNGVLFTAWYTGTKGEGPGNYITLSVSTDRGQTWKNDELIINPTNPDVRFFDPALWTDKNGNIFLSWAKSTKTLWDGTGGVWYSQIKFYNNRIYYLPAKRLANGVMMCRPTDNYDHTSTFYPITVWKTTTANNGVYIYKSDYDVAAGSSYDFNEISTIPFNNTLRTYDEHQVIQLKDKSYYAMLRGIDGLYYTQSLNNAMTGWSTAKKFADMANTSSRFFLGRLKSGKIALVINNNTVRNNLKIYLSDDEMKTWKYSMLIDSRLPVTYPDLVEGADHKLYMVYDYDRFGKMAINCVSFSEQDIINNSTSNITRTLISGTP